MVFSVAYHDQDRAVASHTTSTRGSRFEIEIPKPFLDQGAFDAQNVVTVPVVKVFKKLGRLTADEFAIVEDALRHWLGL